MENDELENVINQATAFLRGMNDFLEIQYNEKWSFNFIGQIRILSRQIEIGSKIMALLRLKIHHNNHCIKLVKELMND